MLQYSTPIARRRMGTPRVSIHEQISTNANKCNQGFHRTRRASRVWCVRCFRSRDRRDLKSVLNVTACSSLRRQAAAWCQAARVTSSLPSYCIELLINYYVPISPITIGKVMFKGYPYGSGFTTTLSSAWSTLAFFASASTAAHSPAALSCSEPCARFF